jgi:UDP-N-acetylglucosamine--N-acetylmuramyl-(pentapeptide) pyrophosphoryl-undecaprenol N-acetylglucosamine transferase
VERDEPQIVFAGGGTGGHLFPALAVAAELARRRPRVSIWFIGAERGLEQRLVPEAGYRLRTLRIRGLKGQRPLRRVVAAAAAGWAVCRCLVWLAAARPGLVIGAGGYASGPAMLAARLLRLKTMVLEQNHYPGATNRWLAPRVDAVCVPSAAARERLGGVGVVTGNPVRAEFKSIGDPPGAPVLSLLVFGGSRGARSINRATFAALEELARLDPPPRICHQTGTEDAAAGEQAARSYPGNRYEALAFLDDMPARLAAADLAICRAGATTLAELTVAGRPAILVPYPHAADDHQRHNAETLEAAGAAIVIRDAELDGRRLAGRLRELDADRPRLRQMARAARGLGRPEATVAIADIADGLLAARGAQGAGHVS